MILIGLAHTPENIMKRYEKPTLTKSVALQTIVALPSGTTQ
jgi:hypothetical protein